MNHHQTIGVLGQGIIGSRVAEHLRAAGHPVMTWSQTGRSMVGSAASLPELASGAMVLQIFLRDDAALLAAVDEILPALTPEHVVMNHATVSKDATLKAAALCAQAGAAFLDAPFTGSKMAAQNAKLVYYVGGDPGVLEKVRPILELSSTQVLMLGAIGEAMVLKIVTNLISSVTVKALAEAAAITRSQGIPLEQLLTALQSNGNFSTLLGMKLPSMISGDFEPHFSLRNMLKDADFARALADEAGVAAHALEVTAEAMRAGVEAGRGDLDFGILGKDERAQ